MSTVVARLVSMLRATYHVLLPESVRQRIRAARLERAFTGAYRDLRRAPLRGVQDAALMRRLVQAWDNEGWSAHGEYLRRMVEYLYAHPNATVLECGSGLSTLVLGAAAEQTNAHIYSLEHHAGWRSRVLSTLAREGVDGVTVVYAPLQDFGAFDWYHADSAVLAQRFDLVVCDGPPGATRGGRVGLLPVMRGTLADDCVILLDDASREHERAILTQWTARFGGAVQVSADDTKQFGEYRLGGVPNAVPAGPRVA